MKKIEILIQFIYNILVENGGSRMIDFILCTVQYLLIMLVLAGIGGFGAFLGIKLRKARNKKELEKKQE